MAFNFDFNFKFTLDVNGGTGSNLVFGNGSGQLSLDDITEDKNHSTGIRDENGNTIPETTYIYVNMGALCAAYSHLFPTRAGYILKGWRNKDSTMWLSAGYDFDYQVHGNDVWYAVWEANPDEIPVRVHIKILLPDGTASDNAGSIGYCSDSPVEPYTKYTRISNGVIQFSFSSAPHYLFFKYFEPGLGVRLSSWSGVSTVSGLIDDIAWQLMMNDGSSDYYVTFVTELTPQSVYISPQGDLYAREFLIHAENKIMITPEGDIYADEYIEDTSFKMLNGKLHAKSFNVGMPNEYQ